MHNASAHLAQGQAAGSAAPSPHHSTPPSWWEGSSLQITQCTHTDVCPKGALIAGTSAGILGPSMYFTAGSERGSHLVTLCWAFCRGPRLMRKNSANYGLRKPT